MRLRLNKNSHLMNGRFFDATYGGDLRSGVAERSGEADVEFAGHLRNSATKVRSSLLPQTTTMRLNREDLCMINGGTRPRILIRLPAKELLRLCEGQTRLRQAASGLLKMQGKKDSMYLCQADLR